MATSEFVQEVSEADFQTSVIDKSSLHPIVVDFWAPWCGPCRTLGPILEELAAQADGRWTLAKINSDENPGLAETFGVRGIPHVVAFVDGKPVDQFTGAIPRPQIVEFLNGLIPSEADRLAAEATAAAEEGDRERELELWGSVLDTDPQYHVARVRRARLRLRSGDAAGAREDLQHVPEDSDFHADAENLLRFTDWAERVHERGGIEAIRERAADEPDTAEHRYDYGCALALSGDFECALAEFLEVVRRDRTFEGDAGRKAMVALFAILGDEHDLTADFRHRLSLELY